MKLNKKNNFENTIKDSIKVIKSLSRFKTEIGNIVEKIHLTIKKNNRIFICGNGGSAAEANHLAAEFVVRLNPKINRAAYPVISLASNSSILTACGNDYGFNNIFSRSLEALGKRGDLLITLSTSGNSKNIIEVLKMAKKKNIDTVSLLGSGGGKAKKMSKTNLIVQSRNVAKIQEAHLLIGHYIFNEAENKILDTKK